MFQLRQTFRRTFTSATTQRTGLSLAALTLRSRLLSRSISHHQQYGDRTLSSGLIRTSTHRSRCFPSSVAPSSVLPYPSASASALSSSSSSFSSSSPPSSSADFSSSSSSSSSLHQVDCVAEAAHITKGVKEGIEIMQKRLGKENFQPTLAIIQVLSLSPLDLYYIYISLYPCFCMCPVLSRAALCSAPIHTYIHTRSLNMQ